MKTTGSTWQKRLLMILGALVFSVSAAFLMRSFDTPTDPWDDLVLPSNERASEETLRMFATAGEQMQRGDYMGALETYEGYLDRVNEIPPEQLSSYFGDLGLAHLQQGHAYAAEGNREAARGHYERAAFMFEQASSTAVFGPIRSVADYYHLISSYYADDFERSRNVGEAFLRDGSEPAVAAELLPADVQALVKEILSVSYFQLAEGERDNAARARSLRENGMRYAEEAIREAPGRVIQPYYYTGMDAWERGDAELARERLERFLARMSEIPQDRWDGEDRMSVDEAREVVLRLQAAGGGR